MKPSTPIFTFFATVRVDPAIHAQALGFTNLIYQYVWAQTAQDAVQAIKAALYKKGIGFTAVLDLDLAHDQDPSRYTFPEQIIGLPRDVVEMLAKGQGLPAQYAQAITLAKERQFAGVTPLLPPHELMRSDFQVFAWAVKLNNHGRKWEVFVGRRRLTFVDAVSEECALHEAHRVAVNNALWGNSESAPWATDPTHTLMGMKPSMPPAEVIAEYPDLQKKFAKVIAAQYHAVALA